MVTFSRELQTENKDIILNVISFSHKCESIFPC